MSEQKLHPDFQTNPPDTEYFFLGSGKVQAAIQWSRNPECTPLGIILSMPNQFSRKWGSLLFHPEFGLERTMITVIIDGIRYKPTHSDLKVCWSEFEGVPQILATWHAGEHEVSQSFCTSPDSHALIEWIGISSAKKNEVEIETALYANPALFSSFGSKDSVLYASGYNIIYISSLQPSTIFERYIKISAQPYEDGKEAHLVYVTGTQSEHIALQSSFEREKKYWQRTSNISSSKHENIVGLFNAAKYGLRAVVSSSGRFDSGSWQYGMEWGRDAGMVAEALVYSGQFELAKSVLENILTRLSNDEGMVAEASRFRGGMNAELDSNGIVLRALHVYYEWTGDKEFIKEYWQRISAIAEYLLRPEFLDEETGLFKSTRDIWERNEAMGIKPGYDIAHQTFAILGLQSAIELARAVENNEKYIRWKNAADKSYIAYKSPKTHSMIENGKIIKRRLIDGTVQKELVIDPTKGTTDFFSNFTPGEMPLAKYAKHQLEPDVSQCFPIVYHLIDTKSDIAKATMEQLETLWNQAWEGGGYGRYDISGEPDSPGPWALATCFMAQAYFEMGENEKAVRAVNWLIEKAGAGGAFFEFYGERPTPPLPPIGILPWAWAQLIILVVKNILGAEVKDAKLELSPKIGDIEVKLRFGS